MGHRVVVRRRLERPGPGLTDLLGELVRLEPDRLVLRGDDGTEREVPLDAVVAAKRVPPRPARYSEMAALEVVADACWPAPVHERLGDWFLRAAEGFTNRANSALPIGEAGLPLEAAIEACQRWYADRGLTPKVTVPLPLRRDVAAALTASGWVAQPKVLVQTAALAPMAGVSPEVFLSAEPSPEFLAVVADRKSSLPASARHLLTAVPAVRFAEVRAADGSLAAIARAVVVREWMHLGLVEVTPAERRRGLARIVSRALATWALTEGASRAVLQVEEHNGAAVALYASMGFTTHHRYITFHTAP